jgi:hypothetical protein
MYNTGAFLLRKNRAFRSNLFALQKVFPLQSLARLKIRIHADFQLAEFGKAKLRRIGYQPPSMAAHPWRFGQLLVYALRKLKAQSA